MHFERSSKEEKEEKVVEKKVVEKKVKEKKVVDKKVRNKKAKVFSFSYRIHQFSGTHDSISNKITAIINTPDFKGLKEVKGIVNELSRLEKQLRSEENKSDKVYKNAGINYLKYLYTNKDYIDSYYKLVFSSLKILYNDAARIDIAIEEESIKAHVYVNDLRAKGKTVSEKDLENLAIKDNKYNAHKWMQSQLEELTYGDVVEDNGLMKEFKKAYLSKIFTMLQNQKKTTEIEEFLEIQLADFYHKKSVDK